MSLFLYSFSFDSSLAEAYSKAMCSCPECKETFKLTTVKFDLCPKCSAKLKNCSETDYLYI